MLTNISSSANGSETKHIRSKQFQELLNSNDVTLVDVRTLSEYKNGHIANAIQLDFYADNFADELLMLPKNKPILLYCKTGYRSRKAANFLTKNGYENIYNLKFGILEWDLLNLPTEVAPNDALEDMPDKMDAATFKKLIASNELVFIDFYAPWCAPCKQIMPLINTLETDYKGRINVVKINIEASKELVKTLRISGVPYFVMYQNGEQIYTKKGAVSKSELTKLFEQILSTKEK